MAHCLVNDTPETFDFIPETWGQLLASLDTTLRRDDRVVTAVRFDGVDQPSFRSGALAAAALNGIARVDVDAPAATALLHEAVDAAVTSLPDLLTGVRMTAAALRAGAPDAHAQLVALVAAVQSLVALSAAAATAADLSLGEVPGSDALVIGTCGTLEAALGQLVAHQSAQRWSDLADALDDALAPAVANWRGVLEPIRDRARA